MRLRAEARDGDDLPFRSSAVLTFAWLYMLSVRLERVMNVMTSGESVASEATTGPPELSLTSTWPATQRLDNLAAAGEVHELDLEAVLLVQVPVVGDDGVHVVGRPLAGQPDLHGRLLRRRQGDRAAEGLADALASGLAPVLGGATDGDAADGDGDAPPEQPAAISMAVSSAAPLLRVLALMISISSSVPRRRSGCHTASIRVGRQTVARFMVYNRTQDCTVKIEGTASRERPLGESTPPGRRRSSSTP